MKSIEIINKEVAQEIKKVTAGGLAETLLIARICENCTHWDNKSTDEYQRECTNEKYKNRYQMESLKTGCFATCGWFKRTAEVKEMLRHIR